MALHISFYVNPKVENKIVNAKVQCPDNSFVINFEMGEDNF